MRQPTIQLTSVMSDSAIPSLRPSFYHGECDESDSGSEQTRRSARTLWIMIVTAFLAMVGYLVFSAYADAVPSAWMR